MEKKFVMCIKCKKKKIAFDCEYMCKKCYKKRRKSED